MSFNDRDWYRDELKKKTNKQRTALTNNAKTNLANRPSEPSKNSLLKTLLTASLLMNVFLLYGLGQLAGYW
jgi:hypothetical protein